MLPSSSSQLARFGQISHYKKFWLLQTQLEKQEQSTSTALSLGVTGNANVKESKPLISSTALIANGDHLINNSNLAGHGSCRGEKVTSNVSCSSRAGAFQYCSNEPAGSSKFYTGYTHMSDASLQRDSPPLSLAVDCTTESVAHPHHTTFFNQTWSPSTPTLAFSSPTPSELLHLRRNSPNLESLWACNIPGQVKASPSGEECESSECSNGGGEKKGLVLWDNYASLSPSSASSISLSTYKQHREPTGFHCNDSSSVTAPSSLHEEFVAVLPSSSIRSGHGCTPPLRTCSLCGTSKTPLWRSGPDGPKSLCNACGIRMKKTKRLQAAAAMEAGGRAAGVEGTISSAASRLLAATTKAAGRGGMTTQKRKLSMEAAENQSDPIFQLRKKKKKLAASWSSWAAPDIAGLDNGTCNRGFGGAPSNLAAGAAVVVDNSTSSKKFSSLFAQDVEEAAVLLMALSCGLVLS